MAITWEANMLKKCFMGVTNKLNECWDQFQPVKLLRCSAAFSNVFYFKSYLKKAKAVLALAPWAIP